MTRRTTFPLAVVALLVALQPCMLRAEFTPTLTLQDLVDGQSITVFDKLLDNWSVLSNASTLVVDLSQIDVTPVADDPLNPGVKFTNNGPGAADGGQSQLEFQFTVQTLSGKALIKDNSLTIDQFTFGNDGNEHVKASENVYVGLPPVDVGNLIGVKDTYAFRVGGTEDLADKLFDEATFSPVSVLTVDVLFTQSAKLGAYAKLDMVTLRFSQLPEPAALVLGGFALVAFVGYAWRRRRSAL